MLLAKCDQSHPTWYVHDENVSEWSWSASLDHTNPSVRHWVHDLGIIKKYRQIDKHLIINKNEWRNLWARRSSAASWEQNDREGSRRWVRAALSELPLLRPAASMHGSLDVHMMKPWRGRLIQLARKESQKQVQQEAPFVRQLPSASQHTPLSWVLGSLQFPKPNQSLRKSQACNFLTTLVKWSWDISFNQGTLICARCSAPRPS